ncbi:MULTISPECIES: nitrous oxide reductase accessory protein NosL [Rhodonellum]|nr:MULTISPECIES: nitrous oxide reductase accessory protein NosL [Rhodonellum]SDZ28664.1 copper chaperone NosL [Rhodonellum ikkaensis]
MRNITTLCCILMFLASCNVEPRAIRYGEEICHHCKMKLMDPHFGAEVLTEKGKIFIFDDVNCLMTFLESNKIPAENIKKILVADYHSPESLIDASNSFYLKSEQFKTPMASSIAAFGDYETLKEYKTKHGGIYLAWGELMTQFK